MNKKYIKSQQKTIYKEKNSDVYCYRCKWNKNVK